MPTWHNGMIDWTQVDRVNNVIQVSTNATNPAVPVYWWRNEQPGEDLYGACRQFAGQFSFAAAGTNVVPCVVQEWSPTGTALIQTRSFGFTTGDIDLVLGD